MTYCKTKRLKKHNASSNVKEAYEALRQHKTPDGETRRRMDTCDALTKRILQWDLSEKRQIRIKNLQIKLTGLQVRGFYSSKKIPLPVTYTREFIPVNLSHIPTPKTARCSEISFICSKSCSKDQGKYKSKLMEIRHF